jgi:hypothetical protein
MIDPTLESASAMLDCRFFGIPIELSASVAAQPLGPIVPGPVDYTVQTFIGILPEFVELLSSLDPFAPVQFFNGVVESTLGSVEPNPITTQQPADGCVLGLVEGASIVGLASEPTVGTWLLQESATAQGLTLRDIEFAFSIAGLETTLTTAGPEANCTWDPAPPTVVVPR